MPATQSKAASLALWKLKYFVINLDPLLPPGSAHALTFAFYLEMSRTVLCFEGEFFS